MKTYKVLPGYEFVLAEDKKKKAGETFQAEDKDVAWALRQKAVEEVQQPAHIILSKPVTLSNVAQGTKSVVPNKPAVPDQPFGSRPK